MNQENNNYTELLVLVVALRIVFTGYAVRISVETQTILTEGFCSFPPSLPGTRL
jgi:hypothetical protein